MLRSDIIKLLLFAVIVFICVDSSAQKMTQEKGLTTANFVSDNGTVFIYVPVNIKAGDQVTTGFSLEAVGRNDKQKQKALDELKKSVVVIVNSNNTSSLSLAQAKFFSPTAGLLKAFTVQGNLKISLTDAKQHTPTADINLPEKITTQTPSVCLLPTHALTGAPLQVRGPFDGDASNTSCSLKNKELPVVAESPRECFVSYPADAKGIQTLVIHEMGQQPCVQNVSSVTMNITAGKLSLLKGERTYIDVSISGLQNLPDTAVLTLDNVTTNVVKLQPMNHVVIPLIPDSVKSGTFNRRFDIQSIKTGNFTVNVNLDLPDDRSVVYNFDLSDLKNESGYQGSYGYIGDQPCEPEGKTITWRWHKTFKCEIDDRKILMCGHTKEGDDVLEKLKELLKELEMDKASDISEKMAKVFSTAKTFSYSIHVIRKWVDYDIYYKCVNGKWQPYGGVYISIGTDDLGWHSAKHPTTECWMTFDSPAAEKEFETALENALRAACK